MIVKEQYKQIILRLYFDNYTYNVLGYKYLDLHHEEYAYEKISVALWC
jgi:hypothetical protein